MSPYIRNPHIGKQVLNLTFVSLVLKKISQLHDDQVMVGASGGLNLEFLNLIYLTFLQVFFKFFIKFHDSLH